MSAVAELDVDQVCSPLTQGVGIRSSHNVPVSINIVYTYCAPVAKEDDFLSSVLADHSALFK